MSSVNAATPNGAPPRPSRKNTNLLLALVVQWASAMLVISRRKGQRVLIGEEIEVVVTEVHRGSIKLGIRAPRGLTVLRGEICDSLAEAKRTAAPSSAEDAEALAPVEPAQGPGKLP